MRGIISRIGKEAGISAVYWKYGVCLYEKTTRSHALIEERMSDSTTTWSGQIGVFTRGGQAVDLLRQLQEWIEREIERSGCRDWEIKKTPDPLRLALPRKAGRGRAVAAEPQDAAPERALEFTPPPSDTLTYCVSYAWNNKSKAKVDRLCEEAKRRGIEILRDTTGLGLGESITKFMKKLGSGDRVFVILSDKYLKSPYCMYELLEVWRNCKSEDDEVRRRIRVFRLPDAKVSSPLERARCAKYWKEQFTELDTLVREHGADLLGEADFKRYKLMQDFAHRVGDMLALIADTLLPKDFKQLMEHGFNDEKPRAPSS
jgi:internalin A